MSVVVVSCAPVAVNAAATILSLSLMVAALTIAGRQVMTKRAVDGAINNPPFCKEEEDLTSWLTPAFLVLPKTKTRKKLESVPPIFHPLSFFIYSQNTTLLLATIFHRVTFLFSWRCWKPYVSLGSPNHNPHTRSYRGILRMYLWDTKKKGVNVGNPRHKNTVTGSVLCSHNREMSAKSADIWLSRQHVANMSPTCHQHVCV